MNSVTTNLRKKNFNDEFDIGKEFHGVYLIQLIKDPILGILNILFVYFLSIFSR